MRYLDGPDLKTLLEQEGPLGPARALTLLEQVASALGAAHARGLVHRDVKPANILLEREPDQGREWAYLTDFGLTTRTAEHGDLTEAGRLVGTLHYLAPEQIVGGPITPQTDVYALGCVLYHCLVGEVPYPNHSTTSLLWAHLNEPPPSAGARNPTLPAPTR